MRREAAFSFDHRGSMALASLGMSNLTSGIQSFLQPIAQTLIDSCRERKERPDPGFLEGHATATLPSRVVEESSSPTIPW